MTNRATATATPGPDGGSAVSGPDSVVAANGRGDEGGLDADGPGARGSRIPAAGRPVGCGMADYVLGNVRAVLPDRVLDEARIVVSDGRIEAVEPQPAGSGADLDGGGLLVLPGLVDAHSDALEVERLPRPTAPLPWDFAITSFEAKLRAAGVSTIFHGAGYRQKHVRGKPTQLEDTRAMVEVIDAQSSGPVDHRVLHRLDLFTVAGREALARRIEAMGPTDPPPLVSHEDHTPGRGQYADPEFLIAYMMGADGKSREEAEARVVQLRAEAEAAEPERRKTISWLTELSLSGRIRLLGHDPDSVESIEELLERGAEIAEFPTTMEAARHARARGMLTVAGAPNLMRGESHSGNVSAVEMLDAGLLDALASDYLPPSLLGSVRVAADIVGLPAAVGLVTSGPARVAGLTDRGRLAPGQRADLLLVDDSRGPWLRPVESLGV